jgi:YHS domain-containing protein
MNCIQHNLRPSSPTWVVGLVAVLAALFLVGTAQAGEFFEKDGVALKGHDVVAYFKDNKALPGSPQFKAEYKGSVFHFSSAANRDAFAAEPARYAPQYGGYCAYGMAGGYKAAVDPAAFSVIEGKLYLNYNREVQKKWSGDVAGYIGKADKAWPTAMGLSKVHE